MFQLVNFRGDVEFIEKIVILFLYYENALQKALDEIYTVCISTSWSNFNFLETEPRK